MPQIGQVRSGLDLVFCFCVCFFVCLFVYKKKRCEEKASPKLDRSGLERERNGGATLLQDLTSPHFPLFLCLFANLSWPSLLRQMCTHRLKGGRAYVCQRFCPSNLLLAHTINLTVRYIFRCASISRLYPCR